MPAKPVTLRRCIGSTRFGIDPHDARTDEFPKQPSQKDGLGRMCKTHWNAYTAGLARDRKARKADPEGATPEEASADGQVATSLADAQPAASEPTLKRTRRHPSLTPAAAAEGDLA